MIIVFRKSTTRAVLLTALLVAAGWFQKPALQAGSRLGKITGVMGDVIAINLGSIQWVKQGLRGTAFEFDEDRNQVIMAELQVIAVSEKSCLARVTKSYDSLQIKVGLLVDIEGTMPPHTFKRVDIVQEMEENARNYFAAYKYTEPDSANCLAECNRILANDPENSLVQALKQAMTSNYYQWAAAEQGKGNLTYSMIYYTRILLINPEDETAYENIWEIQDMMDAEGGIALEQIRAGRPPDYYFAVAEQYYRHGQYDKSKSFFRFLLESVVRNDDLAAHNGLKKNDRMLELAGKLKRERGEKARREKEEQDKKLAEQESLRSKRQRARYYQVVAEDLFNKRDLEGALVYYLRLLEIAPDDSTALARREYIAQHNMVLIPAGEFSSGSLPHEIGKAMVEFGENNMLYRELPKRWVYLDSFYLDRYEVTNRQYKSFLASNPELGPPLTWKDGEYPEGEDDCPVVYVSWLDAREYTRWIGKRLPTEQEWEKAARGSNGFRYPWGDRFFKHRCNTQEAGYGKPLPVGSFLSGANEYGVLDMAGNVWEWVSDFLKPNPNYDEDLVSFPETSRKVIRGGSFKERGDFARGAFRGDGAIDQIYSNVGFRCARDMPGKQESPGGQ